jgi:hypothetical protein
LEGIFELKNIYKYIKNIIMFLWQMRERESIAVS